jgi:hypothetical protein
VAESGGEFYVGYLPAAPPALAKRTRAFVLASCVLAFALAAALVVAQRGFGPGVFEFGTEREFRGVVEAAPYPVLAVERPGDGKSRYLLSAFGKRGARELVAEFLGRAVVVRGTLAYREGLTMIEVKDGGVRLDETASASASPAEPEQDLGEATLVGEIVDSKCYLGVMKPGNTKAHRDCAVRCISGGIPPVLLVRDAEGRASYVLLVGAHGESVNAAVRDLVAEPVEVQGRLRRVGDLLSLSADPATYRRVE